MVQALRNPEFVDKVADKCVKDLARLSETDFVNICIMAGCDYLPSIQGIGLKTAIKHFSQALTDNKLAEVIDKIRHHKSFKDRVPPEYL